MQNARVRISARFLGTVYVSKCRRTKKEATHFRSVQNPEYAKVVYESTGGKIGGHSDTSLQDLRLNGQDTKKEHTAFSEEKTDPARKIRGARMYF